MSCLNMEHLLLNVMTTEVLFRFSSDDACNNVVNYVSNHDESNIWHSRLSCEF